MQTQSSSGGAQYPVVAITGRFQPFHLDHLELVHYGLGLAPRVIIGITNPDVRSLAAVASSAHRHLAAANPFSYLQRQRMISAALAAADIGANRYDIVPFPLDCSEAWSSYVPQTATQLVRVFSDWEQDKARRLAAGGYNVQVLTGNAATRISASDIRAAMVGGRPWTQWVPPGVREQLAALEGAVVE